MDPRSGRDVAHHHTVRKVGLGRLIHIETTAVSRDIVTYDGRLERSCASGLQIETATLNTGVVVLDKAVGDGQLTCVHDAAAALACFTVGDGAAFEIERTVVADAATVDGPAASELSRAVGAAVLNGQRAFTEDLDDMPVAIGGI